jgi:iron complex transport system substrate-binding protein
VKWLGLRSVWTLAVAGVVLCISASALSAPARIVSLNPCTDAILVEIARPEQIAALSFYSFDPASSSIPITVAQKFHLSTGTAENILRLKPDLVIGSSYTPQQTSSALARFGIRYVAFDQPDTIAGSQKQIADMGILTGQPEKAAALNRKISQATMPSTSPDVKALVYRSEGLVLGHGTLTADLMARAGLQNMSADYGIGAWGVLPLEKIVRHPPPVLLRAEISAGERARGERRLTHPVLAHLPMRQFVLNARLINCGGPSIIPAMQRLHQVRRSVAAS